MDWMHALGATLSEVMPPDVGHAPTKWSRPNPVRGEVWMGVNVEWNGKTKNRPVAIMSGPVQAPEGGPTPAPEPTWKVRPFTSKLQTIGLPAGPAMYPREWPATGSTGETRFIAGEELGLQEAQFHRRLGVLTGRLLDDVMSGRSGPYPSRPWKPRQAWVARECRWAAGSHGGRMTKSAHGLSGAPMGDQRHGTAGYSRVYDLAISFLGNMGLRVASAGAHEAILEPKKGCLPGHRVIVTWGLDPERREGIRVRIDDREFLPWAAPAGDEYVIRTDRLHAVAPADFASILERAAARSKSLAGVFSTPAALRGGAIRFLGASS